MPALCGFDRLQHGPGNFYAYACTTPGLCDIGRTYRYSLTMEVVHSSSVALHVNCSLDYEILICAVIRCSSNLRCGTALSGHLIYGAMIISTYLIVQITMAQAEALGCAISAVSHL